METNFETEQRVQSILRKNPEFVKRYERMKELREKEYPGSQLVGLSDEKIEKITEYVKKTLHFDLPEDYLTFLKLADGFDNGFEHGRISGWGDYVDFHFMPLHGGYVFGYYEDEGHYMYAAKKGIFYCFDRCGHDYERAFDTFMDLLDYMLGLEVREGGIHDYDYGDLYDDEVDEVYEDYKYYYEDAQFVDASEDDDVNYGQDEFQCPNAIGEFDECCCCEGDDEDDADDDDDDGEYSYMEKVFNKIAKDDAMLVKHLENFAEIDHCNRNLFDIGCPPLPMEYLDGVLMVKNGLAWNGFEFYGTYEARDKTSGFVLRDIVAVNEELSETKNYPDSYLIIGSFDEEYYIFDYEDLKYKLIDRLTLMVDDEFDGLEDLFKRTIGLVAF